MSLINLDDGPNALIEIGGTLTVSSNNIMENLSAGLDALTTIQGDLTIDNASLTSLSALSNLTTLGGNITVYVYENLKHLNDLSKLYQMSGSIEVTEGSPYSDQDFTWEMNHLQQLDGSIDISMKSKLSSISMPALTHVGGSVTLQGDYTIGFPGMIPTVSLGNILLPELLSVDGTLKIITFKKSGEYVVPSKIETLGGLTIGGLTPLETISIDHPMSISGTAEITSNSALTTINFTPLTELGGVALSANVELTNINFPSCTSLNEIDITGNDLLESDDFGWLTGLGAVYGDVIFSGNHNMQNLDFLSALDTIDGGLRIAWTSLDILDDISGVSSIETIGQYLSVGGYNSGSTSDLSSIDSFTSLQSVGANFSLNYLDAVETVTFPDLTTVGGAVYIKNNKDLSSVSFPFFVTYGGDTFSIESNPALPNCQANGLLGQLAGWTGSVCINDNLVEAACPFDDSGC